MSIVTNPIILDGTFREEMDALRHLMSHQNAAIDRSGNRRTDKAACGGTGDQVNVKSS